MEDNNKIQMRGKIVPLDYGDWDKSHSFDWIGLVRAKSLVSFHDQKHATIMQDEMNKTGWHFRHYVFWDKGDGGLNPRHNFVNAIEMGSFATKKGYIWNGGGSTKNVIRINRSPTPFHPTQKPLKLMSFFISILSNEGDVVLDPYMGSGTTLRAAKDLCRISIGIEIEEKYCEIAAKRLSQEVFDFNV